MTWSPNWLMVANCTLFRTGLDVVTFFSAVCAILFNFYSHAFPNLSDIHGDSFLGEVV